MKKTRPRKKSILILLAYKRFNKKLIRKQKKHKVQIGLYNLLQDYREAQIKSKEVRTLPTYKDIIQDKNKGPKPKFSETINHLASIKNTFSNKSIAKVDTSDFEIPEIFSLTENYSESFDFLRRLFYCLYNQSSEEIIFNYSKCNRIDVDASVCMDILLKEFIQYYNRCRMNGHNVRVREIRPINFSAPHILKNLFSIGAFNSLKGMSINFPDILPYPLCIANSAHPRASENREVHITQMVDYVVKCMAKMNRTLSATAEKNLFDVIGEIVINAEEHATNKTRYSIGYFQDSNENGEHIGMFHLVILNFGKTIYEKFNDPNCPNKAAVEQMKELSKLFTERKLFSKSEYEEQTLWTLYALQQGVTSKADWKRGHGSIAFIESFFNLKESQDKDNISYLSIVSGNTRIIFDGTYRIKEKQKGSHNQIFKMMTFNEEADIEVKPDKKYVIFAENYFPGTIISASICIKESNSEIIENEKNSNN